MGSFEGRQAGDEEVVERGEEDPVVGGGDCSYGGAEAVSAGRVETLKSTGSTLPEEFSEESIHPIVSYQGNRFEKIERYGNTPGKTWFEYRLIGAPPMGNGTGTMLTADALASHRELQRSDALQRKSERRRVYEEQVYDALASVAELQTRLVDIANDADAEVSASQAVKFRLGLQACESILNRALGKPVTKIDAEITQTVADEMLEIVEGWVVDE